MYCQFNFMMVLNFLCSSHEETPFLPLCSNKNIVEDLKTDREEFYEEIDREDLVKQLQEEYHSSAKGKWQMLQKLVNTGQMFIRHFKNQRRIASVYEAPSHVPEQSHVTTKVPVGGQKTIIAVHHGKQNGFHIEPKETSVKPKQASKVKFATRYTGLTLSRNIRKDNIADIS